MSTIGQSTVSVTGSIDIASARRSSNIALTQSIGEVETKGPVELTLGAGETRALPLDLSTGVDEVLFLYLYSPKKLVVRVTGKDASHPGPIEKGLKGIWMETFTPGEGVTAITVTNPGTDPVTIEYAYAAKADAADVPAYWND